MAAWSTHHVTRLARHTDVLSMRPHPLKTRTPDSQPSPSPISFAARTSEHDSFGLGEVGSLIDVGPTSAGSGRRWALYSRGYQRHLAALPVIEDCTVERGAREHVARNSPASLTAIQRLPTADNTFLAPETASWSRSRIRQGFPPLRPHRENFIHNICLPQTKISQATPAASTARAAGQASVSSLPSDRKVRDLRRGVSEGGTTKQAAPPA